MPTIVEKLAGAMFGTRKRDRIANLPEGQIAAGDVHLVDDPEMIEEMKKPKVAKPRL